MPPLDESDSARPDIFSSAPLDKTDKYATNVFLRISRPRVVFWWLIYLGIWSFVIIFLSLAGILLFHSGISLFFDCTSNDPSSKNGVPDDKKTSSPSAYANKSFEIYPSPNNEDIENTKNTTISGSGSSTNNINPSTKNEKPIVGNKSEKGVRVKNKESYSFHFKGLKNINISNNLACVDHALIALTLLISGYVVSAIAIKPPSFGKAEETSWKEGVDKLKDAMKDIDKLILSMVAITLSLKFLINIVLEEDNPQHNQSTVIIILCKSISISIMIVAIAAYIYLTHGRYDRKNND